MSLSHAQTGIDATSMFLDTPARPVPKLIDVSAGGFQETSMLDVQ